MNKYLWIAAISFALLTSCNNNHEAKQKDKTSNTTRLFAKPKVEINTIGIYLYNGYSSLDAMGPYAVFNELMGTKVFFIAKHKGIIEDGRDLKIQVDTSIDEVKHLDILLIPGGLKETYEQTKDTALLSWIRRIDSTSKYTSSVCTGAWILGAAGLLKGREATTHWYGKKILAEEFGANIQNKRYTHSGKYWTGAGVSAGIDLSLALVNEIAGENYTKAVMLNLEYDPQPPFKGGSENNTDKAMVEDMRKMLDAGLEPAIHPESAFKNINFDNTKDFVCGMPLTARVGDTAHYKGKVFGFCSDQCKQIFLDNPSKYLNAKQ